MSFQEVAVLDHSVQLWCGEWRLRKRAVRIFSYSHALKLFHIDEFACEAALLRYKHLLEPLLLQQPAGRVNSTDADAALGKWEANDFDLSHGFHLWSECERILNGECFLTL